MNQVNRVSLLIDIANKYLNQDNVHETFNRYKSVVAELGKLPVKLHELKQSKKPGKIKLDGYSAIVKQKIPHFSDEYNKWMAIDDNENPKSLGHTLIQYILTFQQTLKLLNASSGAPFHVFNEHFREFLIRGTGILYSLTKSETMTIDERFSFLNLIAAILGHPRLNLPSIYMDSLCDIASNMIGFKENLSEIVDRFNEISMKKEDRALIDSPEQWDDFYNKKIDDVFNECITPIIKFALEDTKAINSPVIRRKVCKNIIAQFKSFEMQSNNQVRASHAYACLHNRLMDVAVRAAMKMSPYLDFHDVLWISKIKKYDTRNIHTLKSLILLASTSLSGVVIITGTILNLIDTMTSYYTGDESKRPYFASGLLMAACGLQACFNYTNKAEDPSRLKLFISPSLEIEVPEIFNKVSPWGNLSISTNEMYGAVLVENQKKYLNHYRESYDKILLVYGLEKFDAMLLNYREYKDMVFQISKQQSFGNLSYQFVEFTTMLMMTEVLFSKAKTNENREAANKIFNQMINDSHFNYADIFHSVSMTIIDRIAYYKLCKSVLNNPHIHIEDKIIRKAIMEASIATLIDHDDHIFFHELFVYCKLRRIQDAKEMYGDDSLMESYLGYDKLTGYDSGNYFNRAHVFMGEYVNSIVMMINKEQGKLAETLSATLMKQLSSVHQKIKATESPTLIDAIHYNAVINVSIEAASRLNQHLYSEDVLWMKDLNKYDFISYLKTLPLSTFNANHGSVGIAGILVSFFLYNTFVADRESMTAREHLILITKQTAFLIFVTISLSLYLLVCRSFKNANKVKASEIAMLPTDISAIMELLEKIKIIKESIEDAMLNEEIDLFNQQNDLDTILNQSLEAVELDPEHQDRIVVDLKVEQKEEIKLEDQARHVASRESLLKEAYHRCDKEFTSIVPKSFLKNTPHEKVLKDRISKISDHYKPYLQSDYFDIGLLLEFNAIKYRNEFFKVYIDLFVEYQLEKALDKIKNHFTDQDCPIRQYLIDAMLQKSDTKAAEPTLTVNVDEKVAQTKSTTVASKPLRLNMPANEVKPNPQSKKALPPQPVELVTTFAVDDPSRAEFILLIKDITSLASDYVKNKEHYTMLSLKYDLIRMLEALRQFKKIAKGVYALLIDLTEGDGVSQLRNAIIHHDIIADETHLLNTYHQLMDKFSVFSKIRDLEPGNEIASFSKQLRELTRSGSSNGAFPIVVSTEREQTFPFRPVAEQLASLVDSIKANSRDYSDANIPVDNLEAQMKQKSFIMAIAEAGEIVKTMRALPNAPEPTLPSNVLNAFCLVRNQFDHYNVLKDLHQTHSGSSMHSSLSFIMSHFTTKNHAKHSHGSASRG